MKTRVIQLSPGSFEIEKLKEAASVLEQGGLVGFPTETVYGIAARADAPGAIERLHAAKGKREDKPFTYHIADSDDLYNYLHYIPPLAMRLVDKYWPGPMTLVLRDKSGDFIGLRWPKHPVAQDLLRLCNFPVVAPSLNPSNLPPATDAAQAAAYFDGVLDVIVDAGPCELKTSSSIVRVDNQGYEILREGPITRAEIEAMTYKAILFVCSGNTCRSPMAEGLCKHLIAQKLKVPVADLVAHKWFVASAGTTAYFGAKATKESILAMKEYGIDITGHKPSPVNLTKIDTSDYIYTMTDAHLNTILHWNPFVADRARLILDNDENVPDPVGGTLEDYQECARKLRHAVEKIVRKLLP